MSGDPWRQWQTLFSNLGSIPGAFPFAGPGFAGQGFSGPAAGAAGAVPPGFAPFADAGARFAAALQDYLRGAVPSGQPASNAAAGPSSEAARAASERFNDFLRDQFASFFRPPWSSEMTGMPPAGNADPRAPALGPAREQILRAQRALEAWNRLVQAQGKLQRMWSDTLRSAASAFTSRLQTTASSSPNAAAIDGLYDQWIDCAEQAYSATAHSDGFSDALAEHVNAAAEWRRESTSGIEDWAKFWDLPTRSEINSLMQRLKELENAALRSAKSAPAAKSKRSPKRKSAGRKRSR